MLKKMGRHWLFFLPLFVFAGYYLLQNIIGYANYPSNIITKLVICLVLSISSYVICYIFFPTSITKYITSLQTSIKIHKYMSYTIILAFLIILLTIISRTEKIPLIEAFRGATAFELADYRNSFMRGSSGNGGLINYLYSIFLQALMPFAVAYCILTKDKLRYLAVSIFILGASLSLSKGIFLCVSAPMFAAYLMQGRWAAAISSILGFFVSVAIMYILASGYIGAFEKGSQTTNASASASAAINRTALQSDVPDKYNIFTEKNQTLLIINRIIWIPYVTAVDWFRYQDIKLNGNYVLGQSIRPLAYLSGKDRIYLEKEVAELQWGGPSGATSNAVFFADAWLNWGAIGVILYSAILSITIKIIIASGNKAIIAASGFPVWVACFSALPPVYLSAGLGFLLLFALLPRDNSQIPIH